MQKLLRSLSVALLSGCFGLAGSDGTRPRSTVDKYPAAIEKKGYRLGARLLSELEVLQAFATPLKGKYAVVEVALYPGNAGLSVDNRDFALQVSGKDPVFRPQEPGMIAAGLQRKASSTRRTGVVSSGTIGYESRRERYPETYPGRRGRNDDIRTGGPRTTIGIGALRDRSPRPSTDRDRQVMKTELEDKGLPQGFTGSPVAGYLYFEVGKFRKKAEHRLEYRGSGEATVLVLPGK